MARLISIDPVSGRQGESAITISITGQNTHFANTSTIDLGAGITVSNILAADSTHLTAHLNILHMAAVGSRDLTVATAGEVLTQSNAFVVTSGPT